MVRLRNTPKSAGTDAMVSRFGPPVPGEIVVIKVGGSTLGEGDSTSPDIIELARRGFRPVVVHGGGAVISDWVKRLGIQPEFVRGLRRTGPETLNVAVAVLCGLVNAQLVAELNGLDGRAIGLSGISGGMLKARVLSEDLGLVGEVVEVDPTTIHTALDAGMIPVIAPAAANIDTTGASDAILNINADTSAGHIARQLEAAQMIFQTDVAGVFDVNRRLIPRMTKRQAGDLIASGIAAGGMIPKIEACIMALETARTGHIVDGRVAGALLACVEGRDTGTRII